MSQVPGASTPVVTGVHDAPDLRVAAEVELLHERVGLALDGARLRRGPSALLDASVDSKDQRRSEQHADNGGAKHVDRDLSQLVVSELAIGDASNDDRQHAQAREHDLANVLVAVEIRLDSAVQHERRGEDGKRRGRLS